MAFSSGLCAGPLPSVVTLSAKMLLPELRFAIVILFVSASWCQMQSPSRGDAANMTVGNFVVTWDGDRLSARDIATSRLAWSSTPSPFVSFARHRFTTFQVDGNFRVADVPGCTSNTQTVTSVTMLDGSVILTGNLQSTDTLCSGHRATYEMIIQRSPLSRQQLNINVAVKPVDCLQNSTPGPYDDLPTTVTMLSTAASSSEKVFGFGVQYSVWDFRGRVVPILVSEQGVGRGLEPLTTVLNVAEHGAGGNWHTTCE